MSTLLLSRSTNKFKSKLIDRKYKNKHRNERYRDVTCSNKCIDWECNKIMNYVDDMHHVYENDFEYVEEFDNTIIPIWQCPLCTYINIEKLSFCSICNQPFNYNIYNIQSNQTESISVKPFNDKKIKRKSRKSFRKHNKNWFENYCNSVSKYKNEYDKAAVQNKNKYRRQQIKLKQKKTFDAPIFTDKIAETNQLKKSKYKYKRNLKLNVTLRFNRVRSCSDYILAVKVYNKQHPQNQINIKDYALLDCCVTITNMETKSIIKSLHLKPDINDCYLPIISTPSNIISTDDLPIINQTHLFLRGLGYGDKCKEINRTGRRRPIAKYVKMNSNNSESQLIASECIQQSIKNTNIQCDKLKLMGNGSPILFTKLQLFQLLFEYIPQMDVLTNILIPLIGHTFFYYVRLETYAINYNHPDPLGNNDGDLDNKMLPLESLFRKQIEFGSPYVPKYYRIDHYNKYLTYPKEWHKEGHKTRGYGENKWASVYVNNVKQQEIGKDNNSNVIYHCPFCRWFEKNKISNRWSNMNYSRYWPRRYRYNCGENLPLYKKCQRKTKSRKYWRNWYSN